MTTYATPLMAANWSTRAWTVEASGFRMRSTLELARLFAIAVPFEVNSSVIFARMVWTEMVHVMIASGTRMRAKKSPIFTGSLKISAWSFGIVRGIVSSSCLHRGRPIGDGHPSTVVDAREVDATEPLVTLRPEGERGADAEIDVLHRLQALSEAGARRTLPRSPQRLDDDLRVDEPLQADEAERLRRVLGVAQRLGHLGGVPGHQRAVLRDGRQARVVVARNDLRVDESRRVVAPARLGLLEQQGQHRIGADERHVRDRDLPVEIARRSYEGAAPLVGARAQHHVHGGVA